MISIGIDPSTYTGLAAVGGDWKSTKLVNIKTAKGLRRVQLIARQVRDFVASCRTDGSVVCIEGYAYGNVNTLVTLVEIGTAIRLALHELKVPWYDVPPTVLKKFATGKGNAKKAEVAAAVRERWGFESPSDDVVDAFVLARMGEQIAKHGVPSTWKGVQLHEDH